MNRSVDELLETCWDKVFAGEDYLDIKRFLQQQNLDEEALQVLLLKTDEFIVAYQLHQQKRTRALIEILIGGLLLLIGIAFLLTIKTTSRGGDLFIYGAIIFGAWIMRGGYNKYRLPPEEYEDPGKMRGKFERH
jgi:hypothetical protein